MPLYLPILHPPFHLNCRPRAWNRKCPVPGRVDWRFSGQKVHPEIAHLNAANSCPENDARSLGNLYMQNLFPSARADALKQQCCSQPRLAHTRRHIRTHTHTLFLSVNLGTHRDIVTTLSVSECGVQQVRIRVWNLQRRTKTPLSREVLKTENKSPWPILLKIVAGEAVGACT